MLAFLTTGKRAELSYFTGSYGGYLITQLDFTGIGMLRYVWCHGQEKQEGRKAGDSLHVFHISLF
jgi:hypothetical protein